MLKTYPVEFRFILYRIVEITSGHLFVEGIMMGESFIIYGRFLWTFLWGPEKYTCIISASIEDLPPDSQTCIFLLLEKAAKTRSYFDLVLEPGLPVFLAYDLELFMWKFLRYGRISLLLPVLCIKPRQLFYLKLLNEEKKVIFIFQVLENS